MKADPKKSEGARTERAAILAHVRRRILACRNNGADERVIGELQMAELWVSSRQERYDKKPGGLGKK